MISFYPQTIETPTSLRTHSSAGASRNRPTRALIRILSSVALLTLSLAVHEVQAQTFTTLHSFAGSDGLNPSSDLVRDAAGNLYGTTDAGGTSGIGTVFKIDASGAETVLHSFAGSAGSDGALPYAGLVHDSAGNLYGTTNDGGTSNLGTVFKIDTSGNETVLYSFAGSAGSDGANPVAGLVQDAAGDLYGATYRGGTSGNGTVFKIDTSGNETVLHSFAGAGSDGANPHGRLVRDSAGNLYGTTYAGGTSGYGTVFKIDTSGNETVLYSFAYSDGEYPYPYAGLILDSAGNLYGTTTGGVFGATTGSGSYGTVFKIDTSGNETVLHRFAYSDGAGPSGGLVRDAAGNLYGTTYGGGASGYGTVFKIDTSGNETVLHSFANSDGAGPAAGLAQDAAGNLYGTTYQGGTSGDGTVFKLSFQVPFSAFSGKLDIQSGPPPSFSLNANLTQGVSAPPINPLTQGLMLTIGSYSVTIPGGGFKQTHQGAFVYDGVINGVALQARIVQTGATSYSVKIAGSGYNLAGLSSGPVTLTLGQNTGTTTP